MNTWNGTRTLENSLLRINFGNAGSSSLTLAYIFKEITLRKSGNANAQNRKSYAPYKSGVLSLPHGKLNQLITQRPVAPNGVSKLRFFLFG